MRFSMIALVFGTLPMTARSDEGMWLLSDPPRQLLADKYQFDLTNAWLDRTMKGNVRFNNGGSGGFVSADGLIVTNHHIAADSLQKLSTPTTDLYKNGFYAAKRADEKKCPDLELNVLQEIVDVTERVNAAVKPEMTAAEANAARRAILGEIEKESLEKTKLRSDVVTLYQGGLYHLYRYKKYTDVRLVFVPEHGIAFFGGDTDNFEYPRFNLDVAFFRAYENDEPVRSMHFFKWSETGPAENDLVFVTGHPGTTNRLETLAKLMHRRDVTLPYSLARMRSMEAALTQYADRGPEQRRQAGTDIHRVANARKASTGQYQGLLDMKLLAVKYEQELLLMGPTAKQSADTFTAPFKTIADAQTEFANFEKEYALLESGHAVASELFTIARHLVRLAAEVPKPAAERLREYRESNLESLKYQLFSPAPLYAPMERAKITASLCFLAETLGGKHPYVRLILTGHSPAVKAEELVGSKLFDVAERKRLFDGGSVEIDSSSDPLIQLARVIDSDARTLRKRYETSVEEPERQAYGLIAKRRFEKMGRDVAPDATFTLRLAYGTVKGYKVDGVTLPFHTTIGGAFDLTERMAYKDPYELPKRWREGKAKLDASTPFNFVSTADTIGGNSGSPVLNRAGELVGINFDRNRHGLVRNFIYTDEQARHIAVHSRAVIEALRKLYAMPELLQELIGKE